MLRRGWHAGEKLVRVDLKPANTPEDLLRNVLRKAVQPNYVIVLMILS